MAAFGAMQPGFHYIGGGELWSEPEPAEPRWQHPIVRALCAVWFIVGFQWLRM